VRVHTLSVRNLTKVFGEGHSGQKAVDNVSFEIRGDEFFSMLGPSGCGKTTTLRMIAGLETISSGQVLFDGQDFIAYSAFERDIGMVFQSYALFPHMTVFENTAYGLRIRKTPEAEIRKRVGETLEMLELNHLAGRYPSDLSGGQQQRVAIARALVYRPRMLLLDEPLANLDAKLRVQMREEIRRIQKTLGIMTLYVTHDQEEAMSVSDRIGVFDRGRLRQFGAPEHIYANPNSLFVADFIGKANFLDVSLLSVGKDGARVGVPGMGEITLTRTCELESDEAAGIAPGHGIVNVRPEHLRLQTTDHPGIEGRIVRVQFLGSFVRYIVECGLSRRDLIIDSVRSVPGLGEGESARLTFDPAEAILFHPAGAR
jgi:ABC-type spermidine/putrescine transport systems, ATPase components